MNFSLQTQPPTGQAPEPAQSESELPPVERPTRRRSSGRKLPVILGVMVLGAVGVAVASVPSLGVGKTLRSFFKTKESDVIRVKIQKTRLPVTVVEHGNLESGKTLDVVNEVEGQTTIIMIVPEGKPVKKGDLVCELDSSVLRDNLVNQEITVKQKESDLENAVKTLEVANIAVDEYSKGTLVQQIKNYESQIKLAESELERAVERHKWSEDMLKKNYVSASQALADKLSEQKAEIALQNAKRDLDVLQQFTKAKEITELQANVNKAQSDMFAKKATHQLEKAKFEKLESQIKKCKLFAPNDGLVVYANDQSMMRMGSNQAMIEEGATVHERQKIFNLPDIQNMRVNTKVHESMVERIRPGQKAKIRVDAFANTTLDGTVEVIQPLPDPGSWFGSDVKVYTTLVKIDKPLSGLRPGMTAQVEILVTQKDNVLAVPVQAILQFQGKDHVYVSTPAGFQRREIDLGITNDKHVEVLKGLRDGDEVAMNPTVLMTDEEKREAFASGKSAGRRDWGSGDIAPVSPGVVPGKGSMGKGADGKGEFAKGGAGKGQRKGGFGGFGGQMDPEKMKNLPPEVQEKIKAFQKMSPEQRQQIMEKMKAQGGGGFGGGGGGGFGPPGGGGGGGAGGGGRVQ